MPGCARLHFLSKAGPACECSWGKSQPPSVASCALRAQRLGLRPALRFLESTGERDRLLVATSTASTLRTRA